MDFHLNKTVSRLSRLGSRFRHNEQGNLFILFAIMLIPLMGAIGLAVDASRGYLIKSKLNSAVDAAALAGGQAFYDSDRDDIIEKYFAANFPDGYLGAEVTLEYPAQDLNQSSDTVQEIDVSASVVVPTSFMRVFGFDTVTVGSSTIVRRSDMAMELALVMDNTGSMRSGGKITAMKDAAAALIDIIYGDRETLSKFYVSLVPYTATVNVGSRESWLTGYNAVMYQPGSWKGCVRARAASGRDQDDSPSSVERWDPFLWPSTLGVYSPGDNDWDSGDASTITEDDAIYGNEAMGPNLGCGPEITSLTAEKTTILTKIDEMDAWSRGGTMASLGLAWGWRTISPSWQGLWDGDTPNDMPWDYDMEALAKVVILLTDGVNQWYDWPDGLPDDGDFTSYGRLSAGLLGTTNPNSATIEVNDRMSILCDNMKAEGITIYTVLFQVNDSDTEDLYGSCATSASHFFDADSNSELMTNFQAIATEIANLRIIE